MATSGTTYRILVGYDPGERSVKWRATVIEVTEKRLAAALETIARLWSANTTVAIRINGAMATEYVLTGQWRTGATPPGNPAESGVNLVTVGLSAPQSVY